LPCALRYLAPTGGLKNTDRAPKTVFRRAK
jgi:hypothetical protein